MTPYVVLDKVAGETPLEALERFRATKNELQGVPMAYAGRLDPMASGKLLILLGEECKAQQRYHALDKAYTVEILFGLSSDTGDVLGRLNTVPPPSLDATSIRSAVGSIPHILSLPYPRFSAKTVHGKPLHVWTLEDRLDEISIPVQTSTVYRCDVMEVEYRSAATLTHHARERIDRLPTVTAPSKALGADFRRPDVRADWQQFCDTYQDAQYPIATIHCIASSGTYMRSLAEFIGHSLNVPALAYSIHRDTIGRYQPLLGRWGRWRITYR